VEPVVTAIAVCSTPFRFNVSLEIAHTVSYDRFTPS
jgi:hypothetical protein